MLKHVLPGRRSLARFALVLTMALVLVIGCLTTSYATSAPKTLKSKVYSEVYKKGNTVYCSDGYSIYKVNTKTNSVKRLLSPKIGNCIEFIVHSFAFAGYLPASVDKGSFALITFRCAQPISACPLLECLNAILPGHTACSAATPCGRAATGVA